MAAEPFPSPEKQRPPPTTVMELNMDSLVHCVRYLNLQDISNMAISCKYLKQVAYSASVWQPLSRAKWTSPMPRCFSQTSSVRDSYLARHTYSQQLKFEDPSFDSFPFNLKSQDHLLLLEDDVIFSQGPSIHMLMGCSFHGGNSVLTFGDHHARITCMRLFSLSDATVGQNDMQSGNTVLVTSSCDHTIRLWSKGSCYRCCRGHNGEVTTLSDRLLGDGNEKIFASGGVDSTVRLWSLKGKQGRHALRGTLYGHEKPINLMSVAGHNSSLLVSMSKDSKVKVWDTATSSSIRSSCCVGMSSLGGAPVGMKCHGSLVYVASGSSVVSIDLRTMREVSRVRHHSDLQLFDILPSKSLVCTGGTGSATLWDTRSSSNAFKPEPIAKLDGHEGPIKHLHADAYKIVTGGPDDCYVKVWEANTGELANSLICDPQYPDYGCSCLAVAVKGCKIVIAGTNGGEGSVCYRDFTNAEHPISSQSSLPYSKFWGSQSNSDTDESGDSLIMA